MRYSLSGTLLTIAAMLLAVCPLLLSLLHRVSAQLHVRIGVESSRAEPLQRTFELVQAVRLRRRRTLPPLPGRPASVRLLR